MGWFICIMFLLAVAFLATVPLYVKGLSYKAYGRFLLIVLVPTAIVTAIIMIILVTSTPNNNDRKGCNNCGRTPVNYRGYCDRCWEHIVDGLEDHYNDD